MLPEAAAVTRDWVMRPGSLAPAAALPAAAAELALELLLLQLLDTEPPGFLVTVSFLCVFQAWYSACCEVRQELLLLAAPWVLLTMKLVLDTGLRLMLALLAALSPAPLSRSRGWA